MQGSTSKGFQYCDSSPKPTHQCSNETQIFALLVIQNNNQHDHFNGSYSSQLELRLPSIPVNQHGKQNGLKAELILLSMEAEKFSYKAVSGNMLEMTLRQ